MFFVGKRENLLGMKKRTIDRKFIIGPVSAKVVFFVILAAFATFYLAESSQSAKRKIETSDLSQEVKNKQNEIDQFEVEKNRLKALSIIQDKAKEKGMESAGE